MTSLADRLIGTVVPAVPVPFEHDGRIAQDLHDRYVRWMSGQTVGAVAVWAHTGRGMELSEGQREQVLSAWRRGAPDLPLICGVGVPDKTPLPTDPRARTETATQLAVDMTQHAVQGGAAAVMVHPPRALAHLPDAGSRLVAFHEAVASLGLPVLAFHLYAAASGYAYSRDEVERLLLVPGVIGIKLATLDSVMTFQQLAAAVSEVPDALLVTGEDRFLGYSVMMGARCALVGLAAGCTDLSVSLMNAWTSGESERFLRNAKAIDRFAQATFVAPMEGYVQRMLWVLEDDGVLARAAVDPFAPALDDLDRERVRAAVRSIRR